MQPNQKMKKKMWIKRIWIAALVLSTMLFQYRLPSGKAMAQQSKQKNSGKIKKDKLPGRLGLGFGPFYSNYVLKKGLKK